MNFFLSALAPQDAAALLRATEEVSFVRGQVLYEYDDFVDTLYFPSSACISVVTVMQDGTSVETSTVGRESVIGLLDGVLEGRSRSRIFVQIAGSGVKMSAKVFSGQLAKSPALARLAFRHARAISLQAEQGVACNVTHTVRQRLARWLLMTADRVGSTSFPLTQEYMAVMTGVQRSTVSLMAASLKREGVINYTRGQLTIPNRDKLHSHACECYSVVGDEFEALREAAEDESA